MTAYPITVPSHVTAALRPGETAECDLDTGEWYGLAGHERRVLDPDDETMLEQGLVDPHVLAEVRRLHELGQPIPVDEALAKIRRMEPRLRPLTRGSANAFRSRVREMSPHDHALLDDMRRFYERGGAAS